MPADRARLTFHVVEPSGRPAAARPNGLAGALRGVLAGLAAALAGVALLDRVLPPWGSEGSAKLAALAEARADALVVGSSLVLRGFDPAAFDARMAELGHPTRSFNLGLPAMGALEQEHWLARALAGPGAEARLVLWAPDAFALSVPDEHLENERSVAWHDLAATLQAARGVLEGPARAAAKLRDLHRHWRAWFLRASGAGRLRRVLVEALEGEEAAREAELARELVGPGRRGFAPLDELVEAAPAKRRAELLDNRAKLLADLPGYLERVAAFARRPPPAAPPLAFQARWLRRARSLVERHGARLVFVVLPGSTVEDRDWLLAAHARGLLPDLVDLSDPVRHPELYRPEHRFDRYHLDARGARLASRTLAEAVAALLAQAPRAGGSR